MFNAIFAAAMNDAIKLYAMQSISNYFGGFEACGTVQPYAQPNRAPEYENARLRETVDRQSRQISELQTALLQASVAVAQIGASVAAQKDSFACPKLPAHTKVGEFGYGQVYEGVVNKVFKHGANVSIGGYYGYLPVGQISSSWVEDARAKLAKGQRVRVQVIRVDKRAGKVIVSMKKLAV